LQDVGGKIENDSGWQVSQFDARYVRSSNQPFGTLRDSIGKSGLDRNSM
jgi:hypothetical protein